MNISDIEIIDPTLPIQVEFGPDNVNWQNVREYNVQYVRLMENLLTDMLRARGHLFLNEIFDRMGMLRTPKGQLLGWWAQDGDYVDLEIDPDSPDDLIVINMQPAGFIWNKL